MTGEKVELPDGGWLLLRDELDVTERQKRPYSRAMMQLAGKTGRVDVGGDENAAEAAFYAAAAANPDLADLMSEMTAAKACMLIAEWSYGEVSVDALLDLPGRVYAAVVKATSADTPATDGFAPTADRSTPTGPSSE
jgi:hypothetical protein